MKKITLLIFLALLLGEEISMGANLNVGDIAPEFKLLDETGTPRSLSEIITSGPVLLAFYPGDFTPVCTKQLCSYRDAYAEFEKKGIRIVGVSPDKPEKHQEFKTHYSLSFPLLSDPDRSVFKAYGVTSALLLGGASRALFLVDQDRKIRYAKVELTPLTHRNAAEVLEALAR